MKRIAWLAGALLLVAGVAWFMTAQGDGAAQAAAKEFGFIGSQGCKACHNNPEKGEQYAKWAASPHAHAYHSLTTEQSLKICQDKGIKTPPQETPECLRCHVTGWNAKPALLGPKCDKTEGVGCESCHGPAAEWKTVHLKDVAKSMTLGMIAPDDTLCISCHNPQSPTYKEFKFAEAAAKIAHPNPKKAK